MNLNARLEYVEQWESEGRQLKKGMRESQKDRISYFKTVRDLTFECWWKEASIMLAK